MENINLHIYPSNMINESRIFKESKFISKNFTFDKIILLGIMKSGLKKEEILIDNIIIKRIGLFNINKRSILYLYYFSYTLFYVLFHRPKMINIHSVEFLPIVFIAKLFSIKIIYDTHELETEKANFKGFRKRISKSIEKSSIIFCNKVIVVGEAIADEYKTMYPQLPRPYVVLNTPYYREILDNNIFSEKFGFSKGQIIFLYQGAISPSRGVLELIEVFSKIQNSNVVIVFMGYGSLVNEVLEASNMYNNIFYHRAVSPDALLNYTSSAHIGLCLIENTCKSYDYCMPNKMFEYLMAGLPIIVSNLYEMSRFVNKYKVGMIVDHNSKSLIKTIKNITFEDIQSYKNQIIFAKKEFNWEIEENRLLELYKDIL